VVDEVTLTIPRERDFHGVAHLVVAGLALRLNLTIENLEDLQLAVEAILDQADESGDVTVRMSLLGDELETRIGPVSVDAALGRDGHELGLGLRRVLETVVDDVQVDGDWVRLRKRVTTHG
jgi:hypothetical protein